MLTVNHGDDITERKRKLRDHHQSGSTAAQSNQLKQHIHSKKNNKKTSKTSQTDPFDNISAQHNQGINAVKCKMSFKMRLIPLNYINHGINVPMYSVAKRRPRPQSVH